MFGSRIVPEKEKNALKNDVIICSFTMKNAKNKNKNKV